MKWNWFILIALIALAASGCRTDPNIALLERELRSQEDELYELEYHLEKCHEALQESRAENARLRSGQPAAAATPPAGPRFPLLSPRTTPAPASPSPPRPRPTEATEDAALPRPVRPNGDPENSPSFVPPVIEVPSEGQTEPPPLLEVPDDSDSSAAEEPPLPEPELQPPLTATPAALARPALPPAATASAVPRKVDSRDVASVTLNRAVTAGIDTDGQLGDEGLVVLVEPRDAEGHIVEAAAAVSVVVHDPALQGDAARIGRWDFLAADVGRAFRNSPEGQGYQLELLWPVGPPRRGDLQVFVRYETSDGRTLEAESWLQVALPGRQSTRWVPVPRTAPVAELPPSRDDQVRPASAVAPQPQPMAKRPAWSPERK